MTRVDFYLLEQDGAQAGYLYLCRVINKAYQRRHKIYVHCASEQETEYLDDLLWTYDDDSFIPHNLASEGLTPPPPVQLGFAETTPPSHNDILINLNDAIPPFYQQFKRILEVVPHDENKRTILRQHFRDYRQADCDINTHNIASKAVS